MRENGKTWYRICKMLCEYKSIFQGLSVAFGFIIHNVYTPTAYKTNNRLWYIAEKHEIHSLFSVILIIISLTQQELNIIQTKLFSNVHNQFTHSLYKRLTGKSIG